VYLVKEVLVLVLAVHLIEIAACFVQEVRDDEAVVEVEEPIVVEAALVGADAYVAVAPCDGVCFSHHLHTAKTISILHFRSQHFLVPLRRQLYE